MQRTPRTHEGLSSLNETQTPHLKMNKRSERGRRRYADGKRGWKRSVKKIELGIPSDIYSSVKMCCLLIRQTLYFNVLQSSQIIIAKIALSLSSWLIAKRKITYRSFLLNYKQNKILSNGSSHCTDFQYYIIVLEHFVKNNRTLSSQNPIYTHISFNYLFLPVITRFSNSCWRS